MKSTKYNKSFVCQTENVSLHSENISGEQVKSSKVKFFGHSGNHHTRWATEETWRQNVEESTLESMDFLM